MAMVIKTNDMKDYVQPEVIETLERALEHYSNDYESAVMRSRILEQVSVKREDERIKDYKELALFGKA